MRKLTIEVPDYIGEAEVKMALASALFESGF